MVALNHYSPICLTVIMKTLCNRFCAVICGTSCDIDTGSSGESRIEKLIFKEGIGQR